MSADALAHPDPHTSRADVARVGGGGESPPAGGIVVGVDGSPISLAALRWALDEGELRHRGVHVVLSWAMPPILGMSPVVLPSEEDIESGARSELDEILKSQHGLESRSADSPVTSAVMRGNPALMLLEAAEEASLLVVGTRGHGGFAGLLLGSVSQQCAAHARCAVVIVHDGHARHATA
jgi:nucleotide-binding universal stress UspA family protein